MAYVTGHYNVYNQKQDIRSPAQSPLPNQSMASNSIPEQRAQSSELGAGVVTGAVIGVGKQIIDTQVNRTGNQRLQIKVNNVSTIVSTGLGAGVLVKTLLGGTASAAAGVGVIAGVAYLGVRDWQYQIEQNEISKDIQYQQELAGIRNKNFKVGGTYYD